MRSLWLNTWLSLVFLLYGRFKRWSVNGIQENVNTEFSYSQTLFWIIYGNMTVILHELAFKSISLSVVDFYVMFILKTLLARTATKWERK